jgi:hypothetical protein
MTRYDAVPSKTQDPGDGGNPSRGVAPAYEESRQCRPYWQPFGG